MYLFISIMHSIIVHNNNIIDHNNNIIDPEIIRDVYIKIIFDKDLFAMCECFTKKDLNIIFKFPEEIINYMLHFLVKTNSNFSGFNKFFCRFIEILIEHKNVNKIIGDIKIIINTRQLKYFSLKTCLKIANIEQIYIDILSIAVLHNCHNIYDEINLNSLKIQQILNKLSRDDKLCCKCFQNISRSTFDKFINYISISYISRTSFYSIFRGMLTFKYLTYEDIDILHKNKYLNLNALSSNFFDPLTNDINNINDIYYKYIKDRGINLNIYFPDNIIDNILEKIKTYDDCVFMLIKLNLYDKTQNLDNLVPIFKKIIPMIFPNGC
jgi:hypothetical protein